MARFKIPVGVILFALVWLIVLVVPPLREVFRAKPFLENRFSVDSFRIGELAKQYPNDLGVQVVNLSDSINKSYGNYAVALEKSLQYDEIIRRYPKENWIRANRLIQIMNQGVNFDFKNRALVENKDRIELVKNSLAFAREAEKADPGNAFFPLTEAICYLSLESPQAAIPALQRAGKGTRCEDYIGEIRRRRLAAYGRSHPLLLEEKLVVIGMDYAMFLGRLHELRKDVNQKAIEAAQRGDHQSALKLSSAIILALTSYAGTEKTTNTYLYGGQEVRQTVEQFNTALGHKVEREGKLEWKARPAYFAAQFLKYAEYARKHGRSDIADALLERLSVTENPTPGSTDDWWYIGNPTRQTAITGPWRATQIAYAAFGFAMIWLLGKLIFKRRQTTWADDGANSPLRGQVTGAASFSFWAMMGLAQLMATLQLGIPALNYFEIWYGQEELKYMLNAVFDWAAPLTIIGLWLLPVALISWAHSKNGHVSKIKGQRSPLPRLLKTIRIAAWTLTFLQGLLMISSSRGLWQGTVVEPFASPLILAVGVANILVVEGLMLGRFLAPKFGYWYQLAKAPKSPQHNRVFFWRLSFASAGVLTVAISFLFLAYDVYLWPQRATYNRDVERRIELGENEWKRQYGLTVEQPG